MICSAAIDEAISAREALRAARDYAETIVETVMHPLLILDKDLRVVSANDAFYRFFWVLRADTEGRLVYELGNGQWNIPELRQLLEKILSTKPIVQDFEVRHNFELIGEKIMLLNARRILSQGQEASWILMTIEDVTERFKLADAMRLSEIRFRRLFESAKEGILIIDPQTRKILDANPFMMDLLGYSRAELIGKELFQIGLLKDQQASQAAFRELQEKQFIRYDGFPLEHKSGEHREVEVIANQYNEDGGQVIQCNIRDITERKQLEADLRRTSEQLTDADRRKNEFLAMLAHELRNPLAPVRNGLAILAQIDSHEAVAQQTREMMDRQVEHMARLLDDLLDISRMTSGKIKLHKERVEFAQLIRQIVESCRSSLDAAGQELAIQMSDEPLVLYADKIRLAQVVENLLTNAIKYSDQGCRIEVTVAREGSAAVLKLRDRGVGIAPEMLTHIWELFVQAEPRSDRSQRGLGIGLALVRSLVELHDGTVEAQSGGLGQGSEFTVRLPIAKEGPSITSAKTSATAGLAASSSSRRIMVVDDNGDDAECLGTMLRLMGNETRVFYGGAAALEAASAFRPEVAFLDIGMPEMDGYELARRLRRGLNEEPLLVSLTGFGTAEDRQRSREAGFDEHLIKPAAPAALQALLDQKR